jgi:DNA-binding NarL/FixJ family response regulator
MIGVLVAEDDDVLRAALAELVDGDHRLVVTAAARNGREAVEGAVRTRSDVVLMDIRMPELDGLTATREICQRSPATRVVILTTFDLDQYVYEALRVGASGFLLKNAPPEDLLRAICTAHEGNAMLAPEWTQLPDRWTHWTHSCRRWARRCRRRLGRWRWPRPRTWAR